MTTYRISNGVEVPEGLRGKLVEIDAASYIGSDHYRAKLDGRDVLVHGDWLQHPDAPCPLPVAETPKEEPEPRWLNLARDVFWFVCGFVAGAVVVHLRWLP